MTPDQLKELETLDDRWANNPLGEVTDHQIARRVMDLLPVAIAHIKQLTAERDTLMRQRDELIDDRDSLRSKVVSEGKAITRIIAERDEWKRTAEALKESVPAANRLCRELEQVKSERDAAQDHTDDEWLTAIARGWVMLTGKPWETRDGETREEGLQSNITALFQVIEELTQERDAAMKALRQVDQCGIEHFKAFSCACARGIKQALAHAERITGGGE